jgi:hypothetical protein
MASPEKRGVGRPKGTTRGRKRETWSVSVAPDTVTILKEAAKRRNVAPGEYIEEILTVLRALL